MSRHDMADQISPKRVWLYCRVADEFKSTLSSQERLLREYAESNSWEIVGATSEIAHGLDIHRRGLSVVSQAVMFGKTDFVLVLNANRLFRTSENIIKYWRFLQKHCITLYSVLNGNEDQLLGRMVNSG